MSIEVWLNTNMNEIKLPVAPSVIGIDRSVSIDSVSILKMGEIPVFNGKNLKTCEISSFFPKGEYPFASKTKLSHYALANEFTRMMGNGQQLRLIVTGTNINMICLISDYSTREQDGTGDIYFDMKLVEYKSPKVVVISDNNNNSNSNNNRPSENKPTTTQKTHKVKKGDSLWAIAQKYYGKGSDYPKIKKANESKYPKLKTSNIIYVNWELVIP